MTLFTAFDATAPSAEQEALDHERSDLMQRTLAALKPSEAYVVTLRLGLGEVEGPTTYRGIGDVLGISGTRVREIYLKGIKNLRAAADGPVHNVVLHRAVREFTSVA